MQQCRDSVVVAACTTKHKSNWNLIWSSPSQFSITFTRVWHLN